MADPVENLSRGGIPVSASERALVLAGERPEGDPMATAFGTASKVLLPVAGRPMLFHVLDALAGADLERPFLVSALWERLRDEPTLARLVGEGVVEAVPMGRSPCLSAMEALDRLPEEGAVFITTGDHPLLTPSLIEAFLARARRETADLVVGVTPSGPVLQAFPGRRRTVYRLSDGGFCGCNLFYLRGKRGRRVIDFWRCVESQRKSPLRLAFTIGPGALLRYAFRRLSLSQALDHLSRKTEARVAPVILDEPEAAVDVDRPEDRELVEEILRRRGANPARENATPHQGMDAHGLPRG